MEPLHFKATEQPSRSLTSAVKCCCDTIEHDQTKGGNRSLTRDKGWGIEKPFRSARVPSWPRIVWAECTTGARTPRCSNLAAVSTAEERGKESRRLLDEGPVSWVVYSGAFSYWFYRNLPGSDARGCVRAIVERGAARGLESASGRHRVANDAWRPRISSNDAPPSTTWMSR